MTKTHTTSSHTGRVRARLLGVTTAAIGTAFLLRPHALASRFSGGHRTPDDAIVRILGGRQLVQGTAQVIDPTPGLVVAGIAVDVLHASSMIVLAVVWPRYRRVAVSSAAIATATAVAGAAILVTDRD